MKIIKEVAVTDSIFTSSTIVENDFAAWAAATSYTVGTKVIRTTTHRIYQNQIAGVDATLPENAPSRWLDVGPTNKWAMFDNVIGTKSSALNLITIVLTPGTNVAGLAFIELVGQTLSISATDSGLPIYSKTINLDATVVTSVWEWFMADYQQKYDAVALDFPDSFFNPVITITLSGVGTVSIGKMAFGKVYELGDLQYGSSVGIQSFSTKTTDINSITYLNKRANSKRIQFKLELPHVLFPRTYRLLADLESVPSVFVGSEDDTYSPLIVFGFYKDFRIDLSYKTIDFCTLEIEGFT